jgi:hypothetical protein
MRYRSEDSLALSELMRYRSEDSLCQHCQNLWGTVLTTVSASTVKTYDVPFWRQSLPALSELMRYRSADSLCQHCQNLWGTVLKTVSASTVRTDEVPFCRQSLPALSELMRYRSADSLCQHCQNLWGTVLQTVSASTVRTYIPDDKHFFWPYPLSTCKDWRTYSKKFQQDDTLVQYFYFLQAVLHVSDETFTHHQELNSTVFTASGVDKQCNSAHCTLTHIQIQSTRSLKHKSLKMANSSLQYLWWYVPKLNSMHVSATQTLASHWRLQQPNTAHTRGHSEHHATNSSHTSQHISKIWTHAFYRDLYTLTVWIQYFNILTQKCVCARKVCNW